MKLKKVNCIYYFNKESVTLEYNNQYISFNVFNSQSKHGYERFKKELINSGYSDYDNIDSIFWLARVYKINISKGCNPRKAHK